MKYAVIQFGYGVLGIGETAAQATQDARDWGFSSVTNEVEWYVANHAHAGYSCLIRCTDELYAYALKHGGDIMYEVYWSPEGDYADLLWEA